MSAVGSQSLACIGSGIMGGALVRRLIEAGVTDPDMIVACDTDEAKIQTLANERGVETTADCQAAAAAKVIILALPPPAVLPVLGEIAGSLSPEQLVISVAPGVSLEQMSQLAPDVQLARLMPNTPSLVGAGMNAYSCADGMSSVARETLQEMLDAWGESIEIPEEAMNAACALLAVGPTYLLPVMRTLMDAGVSAGLSGIEARAITAGLFAGTGRMLAATDDTPDQLRDMISIQTLDETAACEAFESAFVEALAKLRGLERKLAEQ